VLFLQHVIDALKPGGRCGIVVDEGVLFQVNQTAFVQTKRKLLDECDLRCIVSLPAGAFVNAGAGVKTNLLFFAKGQPTERVWYYDLSGVKVGKKRPRATGTSGPGKSSSTSSRPRDGKLPRQSRRCEA
jgi:type I restriction enzyme M protein